MFLRFTQMAINIPSKSDKHRSQLIDALRILAWQQYKIEKKVSGLEAYEAFSAEWTNHEIQKKDIKQVQKLIADLGYSDNEMLQIRSEYYRNRDRNGYEPVNGEKPDF